MPVYIDANARMVLLHGFIKKTRKMPQTGLDLARRSRALHESELKGDKDGERNARPTQRTEPR